MTACISTTSRYSMRLASRSQIALTRRLVHFGLMAERERYARSNMDLTGSRIPRWPITSSSRWAAVASDISVFLGENSEFMGGSNAKLIGMEKVTNPLLDDCKDPLHTGTTGANTDCNPGAIDPDRDCNLGGSELDYWRARLTNEQAAARWRKRVQEKRSPRARRAALINASPDERSEA